MKLMASSVAPPTRASLPSPPPQHARTGKLYVSWSLPTADFFTPEPIQLGVDFFSLFSTVNNYPGDYLSFSGILGKFLKDCGLSLEDITAIKGAISDVVNTLVDSRTDHLILSHDQLTLKMWGRHFSFPLSSNSEETINSISSVIMLAPKRTAISQT